jgi:ABC-type dipeptide/oligopeptide/nickel transport system ATPase component
MIIINGESGSGKSTAALKIIEKHKDSSLYILMERDRRMAKILSSDGFDYAVYGNGYLLDIKYRILERGGLMSNDLKYVVVDCLNMIKDGKSQLAKLYELEQIEKDFNLEVILILNMLRVGNIKSAGGSEFEQFSAIKATGRYRFCRPEEISTLLQKEA